MASLDVTDVAYIEPQADITVTVTGGTYVAAAGVRYAVPWAATSMTVAESGVDVNCMTRDEVANQSGRGSFVQAFAVNHVETTA